jgi:DNA transposition AAA+ family ATPase
VTRTSETAEAAEALRGELREFMAGRPDLSPIDLTQFTTLGACAGRSFLRGFLPGGKQVISELQNVLELAKAGDILRPGRGKASGGTERGGEAARPVPRRRNVYDTETVRKVGEFLDYCSDNAALGILTAPFGAGKSAAAKIWMAERAREKRSLYLEFDDFNASNRVDLISQVAKLLGLEGKTGSQQAGRVFRAVCEHLQSHPRFIILDQVEMVRPRCLQIVRQIFDRTEVGCAILAAPILLARMRAAKMADFAALQSRVGIWAQVGGVTKIEVSAILKREGICDVDERAFELFWKALGGSIRRLMQAVDLLKARYAGKRITERTIVTLAGSLWGMNIVTPAQTEGAWRESDLWNA